MSFPRPRSLVTATTLAAASLSGGALPAQEQPTAAVQPLLDAIDHRCGQPADGRRTIVVEGTYSITFEGASTDEPVAAGVFREHFAGADRARHRSDMGEFGALERGVAKDLVWEVDPAMGAKVHRGAHAAVVRRYYAILAGQSPRALYTKFERTGTEAIGGVDHAVLRMTPAEGKPDTWYVDPEGRVARIDTALPSPESADATSGLDDLMPTTLTFADWRDVGGVTLPHRRKLAMGPAIVSFTCEKITLGEKLADATFAPPPAVLKASKEPGAPAFGADGEPNYRVVEKQAQPVASIRIKCKPSEISKQLSILLPEVMAHLTATGAKMAGAPFSRYHGFGPDEVELEAGIPVKQPIEEKGRVRNSELPAGKAVSCMHVGPYHELSKAHEGLIQYAKQHELKQRGGQWEIYWTDPGMVPDPKKWRTELFLPIE